MRIAALTFYENDDVFMPVWERYYTPQVDTVHKVKWHTPDFDPTRIAKYLVDVAKELLRDHDALIYADLDEFIVPDPDKYTGLREYVELMTTDVAYTKGYDVLHTGKPLDLSKPILAQRELMSFSEYYCKPLIIKHPVPWAPGLHHFTGTIVAYKADNDLMLFHMALADKDIAISRSQNRAKLSQEALLEKLDRKNKEPIPIKYLTSI